VLQVIAVAFVGALMANAVSNLRLLRRLGEFPLPGQMPRASILVPARNEEATIGACVRSLLGQEYPDFEVLVLDDNSEDRTGEALAHLAAAQPRLRILQGQGLPEGWVGKNWACHQLSRAARGDFLLFSDADTQHHPQALRDAVAALLAEDADLLTAFPQQEVITWSERLLVPVLTWSFVLFLPLRLAYRSHRPGLSVAIGQFMLFRRQAYQEIGGHEAIRQEVVDDLALGRRIKAHSLRWRLVDGSTRIRCRMYRGFQEVFQGISKSLFPGFQHNASLFALSLAWVAFLALQPLAVLILRLVGAPISNLSLGLAAATVGASILLGGISYPRFDFPSYLMFLYPVTAIVTIGIAVCSLVLAYLGRYTWKGRRLFRQNVRWW
jgi:chlorobactene glucosyltransferase